MIIIIYVFKGMLKFKIIVKFVIKPNNVVPSLGSYLANGISTKSGKSKSARALGFFNS